MEIKTHKELFENTIYLLLFFLVVFISTASVISLNPKTPDEINGKNLTESVKGVSTFDARAIKYEKVIGVLNGLKIDSFYRDGGHFSRVEISDTNLSDIEQNLIKVINSSLTQKQVKIIFRVDSNLQQKYTFWGLMNGYYFPIEFDQNGDFEKNIDLELNSENMLGLRIYSKDLTVVKNMEVELEVIEN